MPRPLGSARPWRSSRGWTPRRRPVARGVGRRHAKPARTRARRISAEDAAALVRSGDWVEYGAGIGQPDVFDAALAERVGELEDVKIRACLTLRPRAVLEADPGREHFHWFNWHYTGYDRAKGDAGCANYIPCNLGEIPDYYRRFIDPPEIAVIKTCPKDERGFYNFSLAALWERAIVERAKIVIVEESAGLPYLDGLAERGARERGRLRDRRRRRSRARDPEPASDRHRPCGRAADRRRDRGRQLPADRASERCRTRSARCCSRAVCATSGSTRRCSPTASSTSTGPASSRAPARRSTPARSSARSESGRSVQYETANRNPDFLCHAVDLSTSRHIVMQNDRVVVDQQHDADGPAGPGCQRVRRPPPHQRHGRAVAVRARRLRLCGRQVVHLHVVRLRARAACARAASSST